MICSHGYRRDSPYDAVVMHPKHKGKTLEDLAEGRYRISHLYYFQKLHEFGIVNLN